jgi:DNA-binding transcriptional MerR regulator
MKDDSNFFESLAKNMVLSDMGGDLPKRYLTLRRRRRAIKRIVAEARKAVCRDNMLAEVGFRPPLSVAGETSSIIAVCVEGLELAHVPVAKDFDVYGQHRGMPLCDVRMLLEAETGREWGVSEVIKEYHRLMSWHPQVIHSHPEPRYNKIPRLMEMIRQEREALESRLRELIKASDVRIFSLAAETGSLAKALDSCAGPGVTLGFREGSPLLLDGKYEVVVGSGHGCGIRTLLLSDLRSLLGKPGDLVVIDCDTDGWDAETDSAAAVIQHTMDFDLPDSRRFEYFAAQE